MSLEEVKAWNQSVQLRARELNMRAGKEIFPVMDRTRWIEWLSGRLQGARCLSDVKDFEQLKLPDLDPDLVSSVIADNPDTIDISGKKIKVAYRKPYYGGDPYAMIEMDEEFARQCGQDEIKLPGGRAVIVLCGSYENTSIKQLVDLLERSRIQRCFDQVKYQHQTGYSNSSNQIVAWLKEVGKQIEITKKDNGKGDPIYGYIALQAYGAGYTDCKLVLVDTNEAAEEETKKALKNYVQVRAQALFIVPQTEPWQKIEGYYYRFTEQGEQLKKLFDEFMLKLQSDMNADNFEKILNTISEETKEKLKDAVLGKKPEKQFVYKGNRFFVCSCGRSNRLSKTDMREYNAGKPVSIVCEACCTEGQVHDPSKAKETNDSESQENEDVLETLRKKWGAR